MVSYFRDQRDQLPWGRLGTLIRANPRWIRAEPALWRQARRELPDPTEFMAGQLPGVIWLATSGSSAGSRAQVRWVALSQAALLASAEAVNRHLQSDQRDIWLHALPLFHVGGLGILARAHLSGARIQAGIAGQRWDPRQFHQVAQAARATLTALVPTQLHDLVQRGLRAPTTLRAVIIGGAASGPGLLQRATRLGWPCLPSYGMTETSSQVATAPLAVGFAPNLASALDPLIPGNNASFPALQILSHARMRSDHEDSLWLAGASLLSAYAEWAPGLRVWDPRQDGWLRSGDLGRVTGDQVEVWGRSGDLVKVLGEKVHLEALECKLAAGGILNSHTEDWAVIAQPHPRRGAELILCTQGLSTASERLLRAINGSLLPYERMQRLLPVVRIPRTALGKLQRVLLQTTTAGELSSMEDGHGPGNEPAAD